MMIGDVRMCCLPSENDSILNRENHHLCLGSGQIPVVVSTSDPAPITEENWERAEAVIRDILCRIHPTVDADCKRRKVVEYMQGLLKSSLGVEVFPYGSVPLKTYLPDGDIDLTAISSLAAEGALFSDFHAVLKREEQSKDIPYEVKDIYCIDAEVKLIKCIVQNMVVDISFNQLGGLSTLCFLEQIDQIVGKNHLFKRSIILIKAWCYYESRILGAHHSLISTYALETLVLYIFHVFHSSLKGPLAVLYKFLEYFSKFDWENYCISLSGPVCKSSLPNIVAEPPESGRDKLLLSDEFLRKCVDMFSVPSRNPEMNLRPFPQKHLNIVDPLKENNNLGRSVNRGNFYRIQSAFKYGARKLGMILSLSNEKMINELNKFFASTLDRHGSNDWTHVQNSCLVSSATNSDNLSSSSLSDTSSEDKLLLRSTVGCSNDQPSGRSHNASQLNFSRPCGENTKFESEISDEKAQPNFVTNGEISCILRSESKENHFVINNSACSCMKHDVESPSSSLLPTLAHNNSENLTSTLGEIAFVSISENSQSFKSLLNLSGDYKSHLRGVLFGLYCHSYDVCAPILLSPPMLPQSENKKLWRTVSQSLQLKENAYSTKRKGVLGQQRFPLKPSTSCSSAFNFEEKQQHRGTGTYIPNMGYHSNRTEKNRTTRINGKFCGHTDDNGLAATSQETESSKYGHVLSEAEYPYLGNGKPMPIEVRLSQPSVWGSSNASGFSQPSKESDSDCQGIHQQEGSLLENNSPQYSDTSCTCDSTSSLVVLVADATESVLENDQERVALQSYHLKDEVDFPPLSYRKALKTC